jgi:hypothetical protein
MVGWRAVLLVTIVKSSDVDCVADDELIEAAAPSSPQPNTPTVFELAVGRAFKWDRGAPQWAAAFVASNDAIPRLADLCITLRSLEAAGMELSMVAVAGGLGVLPVLECVEKWRDVAFVDGNVNQLAALVTTRDLLEERPTLADYVSSPVGAALHARLARDPEAFYLPGGLRGRARFAPPSDARPWDFEYLGLAPNLTSLLPPDAYPELAWSPASPKSYDNARRALVNDINPTLYLAPPAPGELEGFGGTCVVWASMPDTFELEEALGKARRDCSLVIPVRSCGRGTGTWCDGADVHNAQLLDPHALWEATARRACGGPDVRVVHYWAPEDRLSLGGPHDLSWALNVAHDGATSHPAPEAALASVNTALLHMFFGKRKACDGDREHLFSRVVSNLPALFPRLERVVVSEFVTDALEPTNPARACLPSPDELAGLALAALPGFRRAEASYAPGGGAACRSVFFSFERHAGPG